MVKKTNKPATPAPMPPAVAPVAPVVPVAAATPATGSKPRIAPVLTAATADVAMPEPTVSRRGSKSLYPFKTLVAVGMSFGITNKTAKNMASIVSQQNRKAMVQQKDRAGNPMFKMNEMKDAAGTVTMVPTHDPLMVATKRFFAVDVDPATDQDKATVRVFRNG